MKDIYLIIFSFIFISGWAQYGSFGVTDAHSIGMGNTYNATSHGLLSVGKNPSWGQVFCLCDHGRIRTCDRRLRRPLLYPTELRDLIFGLQRYKYFSIFNIQLCLNIYSVSDSFCFELLKNLLPNRRPTGFNDSI